LSAACASSATSVAVSGSFPGSSLSPSKS
jgi:hypothetical protein